MKGFIEITQPDGDKTLLNVGGISRVTDITSRKCLDGNTLIEGRGDDWLACMETYDEVKALIAEAQGVDVEPKIESVEEVLQATFKVLRDIKEECSTREACGECVFKKGGYCIFTKAYPYDWEV